MKCPVCRSENITCTKINSEKTMTPTYTCESCGNDFEVYEDGQKDSVLIDEKAIQKRLKEIGKEISERYDEVTLLVTLTGGLFTAADLSKYITIPVKFEFVKVSSYGYEREAGVIELKWISAEKGKHLGNLIIVDDIFDTGNTLDYLIKYIKNNYTYSIIDTMVLLDKPSRRETKNKHIEVTFKGFTIENKFVYGYGLDLEDYERNLTSIYEAC